MLRLEELLRKLAREYRAHLFLLSMSLSLPLYVFFPPSQEDVRLLAKWPYKHGPVLASSSLLDDCCVVALIV